MKTVTLFVRIMFGLVYFVFGLNGLLQLQLFPAPDLPEAAMGLMSGLAGSGYFFPVLKLTETLSGLSLLVGRFTPLALIVIAPVTIQIFLFHAFLAPAGLPMALFLILANIFLGYAYRSYFSALFQFRSEIK